MSELVEQGADPLRIELLRCARRFKRSWIDMAEALARVRESSAYLAWGYANLYAYCAEELLIKRQTVDKLTCSLSTIQRHAPAILDSREVERPIPSCDAVDYFARAVGERGSVPPRERPSEVIEQLREAVFEQGRPLSALRRQFNPILYAKSDAETALEILQRTSASARRIATLLPNIEGLSRHRAAEVKATLAALERDLERLIAAAERRLERSGARAS